MACPNPEPPNNLTSTKTRRLKTTTKKKTNNKPPNHCRRHRQRSLLLLLLRGSPCLSFLYYFKKSLLFPRFDFFFFWFHFLGLGIWFFGFYFFSNWFSGLWVDDGCRDLCVYQYLSMCVYIELVSVLKLFSIFLDLRFHFQVLISLYRSLLR